MELNLLLVYSLEYKKMTWAWKKSVFNLIKIHFDSCYIICTPTHRFLTIQGYKQAKDLIPFKDVMVRGHLGDLMNDAIDNVYKIEYLDKHKTFVYDIEVEHNHNFLVTDNEYSFWGIVAHNCHHISSRIFSRALLKITPKYTIGLSATPHRTDGLTKVINWFIGDIIAKVERKGTNAVYVKKFEYTSNDDLFGEKKRWFKGNVKPDPTKMITNMYKINARNKFLANIINNLRKQDERKTLILSGRIEHLKILKKLVDTMIQE